MCDVGGNENNSSDATVADVTKKDGRWAEGGEGGVSPDAEREMEYKGVTPLNGLHDESQGKGR